MTDTRPTFEVYDFDHAIMAELPEETASIGRIIPLAVQVGTLHRGVLGAEGMSPQQISARLRILKQLGYVKTVVVPPVGKGLGWQRTAKGTALLNGGSK